MAGQRNGDGGAGIVAALVHPAVLRRTSHLRGALASFAKSYIRHKTNFRIMRQNSAIRHGTWR